MALAKENKKVQGAWIDRLDAALLEDEAKKAGFRTSTALASYVLSEWCHKKRIELAEIVLAQSKKKPLKRRAKK